MAACSAFGLKAAYAGAIGSDENAQRLESALASRGVDLSLLVRRPGGNQFAAILIDNDSGERIVLWDRPDSLLLDDSDLPADALRSARAVLVDDVDPRASLEAARIAAAAGVMVTTDLDHVTPFTESLIRTASHPILAEHLPQALTGEADLERALRKLRAWNPGLLTVTVGERGAVALDGDRFVHVNGFPVQAVDTTGSGDVFRGAFIAGLLKRPRDGGPAPLRERGGSGELHEGRRPRRRPAPRGRPRAAEVTRLDPENRTTASPH